MKSFSHGTGGSAARVLQPVRMFATVILLGMGALACAQTGDAKTAASKPDNDVYQTIYLNNVTQQNDLTEIVTDLRNMIPHARVYADTMQNVVSLKATPEEIQLAQKIVAEIDRPKKVYRILYTITDIDGGKRGATQTYSLIATSGERTTLKQGSRAPIQTGKFDTDTSASNTQVQYLDVGVNIEAHVQSFTDGLRLSTKVEQSAIADEKSGFGAQDPILRQTVIDGTTILTVGKPAILGAVDEPGTTRKQEIAVTAELVK